MALELEVSLQKTDELIFKLDTYLILSGLLNSNDICLFTLIPMVYKDMFLCL